MVKKFYITTSIPYTNAPPHIGFALEIIQADVLARYHRSLKEDVFFLTGTDEHGIKTKKAAEAMNKTPEVFAKETSDKFKELKEILNLSNDYFIKTTDEKLHHPSINKLWQKLVKNGDLYKKKYKGFYCEGCEAFKTDKEIVDGKCVIHQKPVELIEEENYFFKLSKYLPQVKRIIEKDKIKIIPASKKKEILGMLKLIEDVSFSRSKEKYWGFFVPGDTSQIIYVWADALSNYISAIGYSNDPKKFNKYWPADVHCIGKDIIKFHTIFWPAMLLALGLELPKLIFVHGFIMVNGQKMSKSLGNIVDPAELVKKYSSIISPQAGQDAVRYYLLREIVPTEDGDFSYKKFEQRYNADLAGGIGNLLSRTLSLVLKPDFKGEKPTSKIKKAIENTAKETKKHLKDFKFNEALKSIWELIAFCDKYINEEKPWEWNGKASQVISDVTFALEKISQLLLPFLPETAEKIRKAVKNKEPITLFPRLTKE